MTIGVDELEAAFQLSVQTFENAKALAEAANASRRAAFENLKDLCDKRDALVPITLESALNAYRPIGDENAAGGEWLRERSWKGEWKDTGLRYGGEHWINSRKRYLNVSIDREASNDVLANLEAAILPTLDVIQAGGPEVRDCLNNPMQVDITTYKLFRIAEHSLSENASFYLGVIDAETALVFSIRHGHATILKLDTLKACLEYIRIYRYSA